MIVLALQSCGRKLDVISLDQIHVWHDELKCTEIVYPEWRRECDGKHLTCNTYRDGRVDCLITFTASELEEKL